VVYVSLLNWAVLSGDGGDQRVLLNATAAEAGKREALRPVTAKLFAPFKVQAFSYQQQTFSPMRIFVQLFCSFSG
jgi:hypothetical protein